LTTSCACVKVLVLDVDWLRVDTAECMDDAERESAPTLVVELKKVILHDGLRSKVFDVARGAV
jgi:hypothetical protein